MKYNTLNKIFNCALSTEIIFYILIMITEQENNIFYSKKETGS